MPYIITVKRQEQHVSATSAPVVVDGLETEIYRQTLEDFNLSKFVIALNKQPRVRKAKYATQPQKA